MGNMNTIDFIAKLNKLDIKLRAEENRLRFDAPPGVLTNSLRVELASRKEEILSFLRQAAEFKSERIANMDAVRRDGPLPLSFAQERLWLLDKMIPGNAFYNLPVCWRLKGCLDKDVLAKSIFALVDRHETLRTVFRDKGGVPEQVIRPSVEIHIEEDDFAAQPSDNDGKNLRLQSLGDEECSKPFNLSDGPLLRVRLIRLEQNVHVLYITMHHIVSDGASLHILVRELSEIYNTLIKGADPVLPELPIQYCDYSHWQRNKLSGERLEASLEYWRNKLADLKTLQLPLDKTRPPSPKFHGARESVLLSKKLSSELEILGRRERTTLFTTALTAFFILLHRYSCQDDITVGSPTANRNRHEVEDLIGFFVNMTPLRCDLSKNPTFTELLAQVRETALDALKHQDMPFEKLVEELQPQRDITRNPLFQVVFALQNETLPPLTFEGLETELISPRVRTARFDLECHIWKTPNGLKISFIYDTALFRAAAIRRMLTHFQTLLESISLNPESKISDLPLMDAVERNKLLTDWNSTASEYPRDKTIHELFEKQAEKYPDKTAAACGNRDISYAELNRRANKLARRLKRLGVGPDIKVGICIERSYEMIAGILGILKAGGAYLPLDPEYPADRLSFMLEDAAADILLTQKQFLRQLPKFSGSVICLDDWNDIEKEDDANLPSEATPNNLAYVIYTSGSTGLPKGACIEHQSVVRLVKNTNYVSLGPDEVFLQFAPISFDASTFELWGSLLNGAKLVVFPAGKHSLEELGREIKHRGITTLWLTAALFHKMVDFHIQSLNGVKQLLAGGETLSRPRVKRAIKELPETRLINGYGPTENTTFTTCCQLTDSHCIESTVPIGTPISNTQVYILDRQLNPTPIGVRGELYIGGDGLARGYLNSPALTAERFIPNPLALKPGARLYKTGDMVRWLEEGTIEFFGRFDHQVKIRGFRIELGEIEAALRRNATVKDVVVVCREDSSNEKRLIAYITTKPGQKTSARELRNFSKDKLPHYMVPSAFVCLDAFPLTHNGKVDRKALPVPEEESASEEAFVPPQSKTEEQLANVWKEVLNLNKIGMNDNFFDLGGHSLLVAQLHGRLSEELGRETPIIKLFEFPTIRDQAEYFDKLFSDNKEKNLDLHAVVSRADKQKRSIRQRTKPPKSRSLKEK